MNHEYVFFNCEIATFLQYKNIIELFKSIIEKEFIYKFTVIIRVKSPNDI